MSPSRRRKMVDREHPKLPIVRECALLGVSRPSLYYRARGGFRRGPVPDEGDGQSIPGDPLLVKGGGMLGHRSVALGGLLL